MNNLISEYNIMVHTIILSGGMRLFLYGKKIVYLSKYQDGKKEPGAGFAKFTGKSNEWCVEIRVKKEFCGREKDWVLYLLVKNEKIIVGNLTVQACGLIAMRSFSVSGERISMKGRDYDGTDISGIEIRGSGGTFIAGYLQEPAGERGLAGEKETAGEREPAGEKESAGERELAGEKELAREKETRQDFLAADLGNELHKELQEIRSFDNKWEQLMNDYPQIHPFGDNRVFITIEPKDFIILQASYQKLVNNSFLLHGFYNYRYLILGPDKEIGEKDKECFYLGVPGTYFERERMVAVMFGFEGFECAGPVEIGKFGFYMRKVEL